MPKLRKGQKKIATVVIRISVAALQYIDEIANRRRTSRRAVVDEMMESHDVTTEGGKWPVKRFK